MTRSVTLCACLCASALASGCGSGTSSTDGFDAAPADLSIPRIVDAAVLQPDQSIIIADMAGADLTPNPNQHFCDLPGSLQFKNGVTMLNPGGPASPSLSWLHLPQGYCAHYFGNVPNVRQGRFAPTGELFVASPSMSTTGGGGNGKNAVIILADDDKDGVADAPVTYLANLPATQGIMFTADHFYYQDNARILRVPYAPGDRKPSGASEMVADITLYYSSLHWPKAMDIADDGTIYVANGGDQGEACDPAHPFHGGILKLDGAVGGTPVAKGLRNPIALRCAHGHDKCFALELAKDYSADLGGREKMLPIRQGDDWGYPCCATKDLPYTDVMPVPNCSGVTAESSGFLIGDTPFSVDFDPGKWTGDLKNGAIVALHGAFGSWTGARVVSVQMDDTTGLPKPSSDINGMATGAMTDFATGWDVPMPMHGRPAVVAFAPDGRVFIGNDFNGDIFWVAPLDL